MRVRRQRREGADGAADLEQDVRSAEVVRSDGGTPRGQVGPASEAEVERLEPSRSFEEQRGRLVAVARTRRQRGLEGARLARSGSRRAARPPPWPAAARAASNAPAWKLASAAASARPAWSVGSGVSAVARSRSAAAAARPPRLCARPAERSSSAATASSGPAAASARCQARRSAASSGSLTSASASCTRRRSSGDAARYTAERTSGWWNRTRSSISSSPASAAGASALGSMESRSAARHSSGGVPQRVRCRQQDQSLRRLGQSGDAPQVLLLQLTRKIARRGRREAPGSLRRAHPLRQLHQRQRIAPGLGDDPVADAVVEPARHGSRQQGARIRLIEAFERQLRQAVERAGGGRLAQREHHRHRFRQQAPRDESERLHRRGVEPLRVVHQAQERALLGGRGRAG